MKLKYLIAIALLFLVVITVSITATQAQGPPPVPAQPTTLADFPWIFGDDVRAREITVGYAEQILAMANAERARIALGPLRLNGRLAAAALGHSQDMADHNFVDHYGSDRSSPYDRMRAAGCVANLGGEVVAAGQQTPEEVFRAWMNSAPHRAIWLGGYTEVGIGWVQKAGTTWVNFWTADFAGGAGCGGGPVATPIMPATPTIPPWLLWTPTPTRPAIPPTATPIPQVIRFQITLICDYAAGTVSCQVLPR